MRGDKIRGDVVIGNAVMLDPLLWKRRNCRKQTWENKLSSLEYIIIIILLNSHQD